MGEREDRIALRMASPRNPAGVLGGYVLVNPLSKVVVEEEEEEEDSND
jgi:hypothetical protein